MAKGCAVAIVLDDAVHPAMARDPARESGNVYEGFFCVIAMEACCGAHHLAGLFKVQGHEVWLMSPEYVRPYVKAQKNDDRDAEAVAEAKRLERLHYRSGQAISGGGLVVDHFVQSSIIKLSIVIRRGVPAPIDTLST